MRPLLAVMLVLGAVFASTFVAGRLLGILTEANVRAWLAEAGSVSPAWIAGLVILLLFIDLFVAVPTLTVTLLGSYFLGFGAAADLRVAVQHQHTALRHHRRLGRVRQHARQSDARNLRRARALWCHVDRLGPLPCPHPGTRTLKCCCFSRRAVPLSPPCRPLPHRSGPRDRHRGRARG